jgi:hypothetical protein
MTDLFTTIQEIIKYGLEPNVNQPDKETSLERNLVKLYHLYFETDDTFDKNDYPDFDKTQFPDIVAHVKSNFTDFGFYKTVLDLHDFQNQNESTLGDAIDDLTDIIYDLLEIKWRIENNSLSDGLWFFKFIFYIHTQQHVLDLLNYLKHKNG